jgi:ribose transport system permease protein
MLESGDIIPLTEKRRPPVRRSRSGISPARFLTLGVFAGMFAFFSVFANNFFTVRGVLNLLVQTSTFTILSIGSLLVLVVGCIDFSLGAVIAFSGTAVVVLAASGTPVWLAMIAATLLSGGIGLANGYLVAARRLPSFVITFAMAIFIYGSLGGFGAFLSALAGPVPHPENLSRLSDLANIPVLRITSHGPTGAEIVVFPGISWIVIIMAVVAGLSHLFLGKTRFGRFAFLVGSAPEASRLSGIQVIRVKMLAFVFASMLAGLVGVLLASRLGGPPGGAAGYEMIGIICAMIGGASLSGGAGKVGGTVIGSFMLSTIAMGLTMMNNSNPAYPMILNGCILVGAVCLDRMRNRK